MIDEELNRHEEQAMDALLCEILGDSEPPDLSQHILARHIGDAKSPLVVEVQSDARNSRKKSSLKPFVAALSVVTALAASMLLMVWLRGQAVDQPDDQSALVADHEIDASGTQAPVDGFAEQRPAALTPGAFPKESAQPRPIPQGIPLVTGDERNNTLEAGGEQPADMQVPDLPGDPKAILLVSNRIDEELIDYWRSIGIEPTEDAALPELISGLSQRLGASVSSEAFVDAESLRAAIRAADNANQIARKWLIEVTDGGLLRIDADARDRLIDQAAEAFGGKIRLDVVLARWFGGDNPQSSDWYAALSASGRDSMVSRIALLSMNVDLRCTRCHDAKIESSGRQEDYWAFTSFIRQSVKRDRDGQWKVGTTRSDSKPLFYELSDGRQRMVQPSIPAAWMAEHQPIQDVHEWFRRIVAAPELARGVVNSLWKLVHGRRLHGGVVDTIAAPHSESLVQIEEQLARDLLESNFDVTRTLALIIHSPATRRSVPAALKPENALLASDAELRAARDVVGAFAGLLPTQAKPSMNRRIDLAMRSAGASIPSIQEGNAINAQADGSGGNRAIPKGRFSQAADGFPTNANDFPVHWLTSVSGYSDRVAHLGYLAGFSQVPEDVREVAEAMKKSPQISEELALHRLWWLLSP